MTASSRAALAQVAPVGSKLADIEHFVILCQENRSFDHYFGTLAGVRGFDDTSSAFKQFNPNPLNGTGTTMLPWHVHPESSAAQCMADVEHSWQTQQLSRANGSNAGFLVTHTAADLGSDQDPMVGGARTMSYFTRADLPFHYALADAFTICDHYFCSVLGPTIPNRLYMMTGMLDPEGKYGGPEANNIKYNLAKKGSYFSWTTYPERLQAAGIDWKVYVEADDYDDNVLKYFAQYQDKTKDITRRARTQIAANRTAAKIREDVLSGNLPQVSWIVQNKANSEHPEAMPAQGAAYIQGILDALTSDPKVWAKTAFIITYDENGGFFDHVVPPTPPPNTPGEFISGAGIARSPETAPFNGPIGLGFRVPTLIASPFSRGGYVSSEVFDHTSTLLLLEKRFGVEVPYLSAWRRSTVGDLTSAFNFGCTPNITVPDLPNANELLAIAREQCMRLPKITGWQQQVMPKQEPGKRSGPGVCAPGLLPRTGGSVDLLPVGVLAGAAIGTAVLRRRITTSNG